MSRWVPNFKGLRPRSTGEVDLGIIQAEVVNSDNVSPSSTEVNASMVDGADSQGSATSDSQARVPWWVRVFPFCLSAFFFLSAFLVIFSPLPILFFHVRKGRGWAWLAALTNGLIVGFAGGIVSLGFYLVWVVALALSLPEFFARRKSVEKSAIYTLLTMVGMALVLICGYSQLHHVNPIQEVHSQVSNFVDFLGQAVSQSVSANSSLLNPGEIDEWKHSLLVEFPSAMAIFSLVLVWANLVLLLRANPNGVRDRLGLDASYLKWWKAPEFLVWPTLVSGFFLVVEVGVASDIALNVFKFFMAIYAIQGLSILSYFFDLWGVRGFFRFAGFSLSLFLMMPLVLSLGFFDLWFDFRGKFRQS